MARFHVIDTFALEGRKLFVLAGSIIDGEIRAGQSVVIPLNSALTMSARIESIGFARRSPSREDVCLCLNFADLAELEIWQGLNIGNETIEVVEDGLLDN
jgi:hypothetical protein